MTKPFCLVSFDFRYLLEQRPVAAATDTRSQRSWALASKQPPQAGGYIAD